MMKLVGICGSLRGESYNKRLLNWIRTQYQDTFELEILDFPMLPIFNPDIEHSFSHPNYSKNLEAIKNADGLIWSTPEYIHAIPAYLKNIFDWLVGTAVLDNKLGMVIIAGSSEGNFACEQIYETLNVLTNHKIEKNHLITIGGIKNKFANMDLQDQITQNLLDDKIKYFLNSISKNQ